MPKEIVRQYFLLYPFWGKALGAFFGYLIGGPAGSLLGIVIGNIFDRGLSSYLYSPLLNAYRTEERTVKDLFYTLLFKVMGNIAKADGRVNKAEIEVAKRTMRELRLYGRYKREAQNCFMEGKKDNFPLQSTVVVVQKLCAHDPNLLRLFVELTYRMAKEGDIGPNTKEKLNLVFESLGFEPIYGYTRGGHQHQKQQYQQKQHYKDNTKTHRPSSTGHTFLNDYHLLGIHANAKKAEIKRAYRKKISLCHPDKLIAKGKSKEEVKAATEKSQQIQAAYERIKKIKGF